MAVSDLSLGLLSKRENSLWVVCTNSVLPLLKTYGQRKGKDRCFHTRDYQVELGIITEFSLDVLIMARLYFAARNATSKGTSYNIYRRETMNAIFFNVIWERKIGIKHG